MARTDTEMLWMQRFRFAGHHTDEKHAREMLKTAIDQKAIMADVMAEATKFLKGKNAGVRHIQREI